LVIATDTPAGGTLPPETPPEGAKLAPLVHIKQLPAGLEDVVLPGLTAIGPVASERKVKDWALVLQSMSVWHVIRRSYAGWVLLVNDADYASASTSIDRYEAENRDWPPRRTKERPRHSSSLVIPVVFVALLAFFMVTGPSERGSFWFAHGVAVSSQVLSSAPWQAVTALTLHANATHVLSNVVSGTVFASAVQRRLGSGGAALAVLASGILGNVGNALYYRALGADHGSLGASTAVFGAIGLLAATELLLHRTEAGRKRSWVEIAGPIVGGFALLGELGSGGGSYDEFGRDLPVRDLKTDLGAHLFGFLAGLLIGVVTALVMRRRPTLAVDLGSGVQTHEVALGSGVPRWWVQASLGGVAAAIVVVAWELALRH
jgi:membrane associated rhomboid family serine protease